MIYLSYYYDFELQGRLGGEQKFPPNNNSEYYLTCRLSLQEKKPAINNYANFAILRFLFFPPKMTLKFKLDLIHPT